MSVIKKKYFAGDIIDALEINDLFSNASERNEKMAKLIMKKHVRPIFRIRCDKCGREDTRTYRTLSLLPQVYTCKSCGNSEISATNVKVVFKVLKTIIFNS